MPNTLFEVLSKENYIKRERIERMDRLTKECQKLEGIIKIEKQKLPNIDEKKEIYEKIKPSDEEVKLQEFWVEFLMKNNVFLSAEEKSRLSKIEKRAYMTATHQYKYEKAKKELEKIKEEIKSIKETHR